MDVGLKKMIGRDDKEKDNESKAGRAERGRIYLSI